MERKTMKVIVDSTCDLPQELAEKYDIDVVPVHVHHEDKSYADRVELTPSEFYSLLENVDELPTTSGANPKDFFDSITEAFKEHSSVLIATITSKLSGTYQSARVAIKQLKDKKVYLIDSKFGSGVLTFLSLAAAKFSRKGMTDDEIVKKVEQIRDKSILVGYVDTLENLKKSGRISNLKYLVGSMIKSKPILEVKDGVINAVGKASGKEKAQKKVIAEILRRVDKKTKYDIMITHGNDSDAAEFMMQKFEKKLALGEKIVNYLTPALGVHLGIGSIVVSLSPSPF